MKNPVYTLLSSLKHPQRDEVLKDVKRTEKKVFPALERMDFDAELRKNNTEMAFAIENSGPNFVMLGYALFSRTKRTVNLHKICVLQSYRNQGIGKSLLSSLIRDMKRQNCLEIALWVDDKRMVARRLYETHGFIEKQRLDNYYGPGRTAIQMRCVLELHEPS